ncbi:MAG: hypothetical protein ABIJ56_00120 [Pseudomonadota bacterium]
MDEKNKDKEESMELDKDEAAAIAAAIILHRGGPEGSVRLFGDGEHDEGFWGRSARAGSGGGIAHRLRRG